MSQWLCSTAGACQTGGQLSHEGQAKGHQQLGCGCRSLIGMPRCTHCVLFTGNTLDVHSANGPAAWGVPHVMLSCCPVNCSDFGIWQA